MRKLTLADLDSRLPALTDDDNYRALAGMTVHPGTSISRQLQDAVALRDAAELLMLRTARDMRAYGRTWDEVGYALGMTRQGAQRFLQRSTHDLGNI